MDTRLYDAVLAPAARYKDFETSFYNFDLAAVTATATVTDPVNYFTVSVDDQESLLDNTYNDVPALPALPIDSTKIIPVFVPRNPTSGTLYVPSPLDTSFPPNAGPPVKGPYYSYWSFGKGYRRCAGEVYVYFVTILLLEKFRNVRFEYNTAPACRPTVALGPFNEQPNNIYAVPPTANFYQ